jgi:hypothetical protein
MNRNKARSNTVQVILVRLTEVALRLFTFYKGFLSPKSILEEDPFEDLIL